MTATRYWHCTARWELPSASACTAQPCRPVPAAGEERGALVGSIRDGAAAGGVEVIAYGISGDFTCLLLKAAETALVPFVHRIISGLGKVPGEKSRRGRPFVLGGFRLTAVEVDGELAPLSRCIHRSPRFGWSSRESYTGGAETPRWLSSGQVLSRFGSIRRDAGIRYRNYVDKGGPYAPTGACGAGELRLCHPGRRLSSPESLRRPLFPPSSSLGGEDLECLCRNGERRLVDGGP